MKVVDDVVLVAKQMFFVGIGGAGLLVLVVDGELTWLGRDQFCQLFFWGNATTEREREKEK